jgi:hypothetical protein
VDPFRRYVDALSLTSVLMIAEPMFVQCVDCHHRATPLPMIVDRAKRRHTSGSMKLRRSCGPRPESVGHSHARRASRITRIQFVRMRQVHVGEYSLRHCRYGRSATSTQALLLAERIVCNKTKAIGARRCNTILINAGADLSQNGQRAERRPAAAKSPAHESLCTSFAVVTRSTNVRVPRIAIEVEVAA